MQVWNALVVNKIVQPNTTMNDLNEEIEIARIGLPEVPKPPNEYAKHAFNDYADLTVVEVEGFLPGIGLIQIDTRKGGHHGFGSHVGWVALQVTMSSSSESVSKSDQSVSPIGRLCDNDDNASISEKVIQ
jgi:hypothetical protein